jgi:hypothetical protein
MPVLGVVVEEYRPRSRNVAQPAAEKSGSVEYAQHILAAEDTLTSLAVRYGSTIDGIMRANGMISRDLDLLPLRCILQIPLSHECPLSYSPHDSGRDDDGGAKRQRAVREFADACGCPRGEAQFYLECSGFDFGSAAKELWSDRRWEEQTT